MISDPKTIPESRRGRIAYAVAVGILATILIAAAKTEFWAKVAVLGALTIVCVAWPLLKRCGAAAASRRRGRSSRLAGVVAPRALGGRASSPPASARGPEPSPRRSPTRAACRRSRSRSRRASRSSSTGRPPGRIAADLVADLSSRRGRSPAATRRRSRRRATFARLPELRKQVWAAARAPIVVPAYRLDQMAVHYSPGRGQGAAVAVASARRDAAADHLPRQPAAWSSAATGRPPYTQTIDLQLDRRPLARRPHPRPARRAEAARPGAPIVARRRRRSSPACG